MTTRHEHIHRAERSDSVDWGAWVSWIGIVVALIGFFFFRPIWLGAIGGILGIIALWSFAKGWACAAIIVGVIVFVLALFGYTIAY